MCKPSQGNASAKLPWWPHAPQLYTSVSKTNHLFLQLIHDTLQLIPVLSHGIQLSFCLSQLQHQSSMHESSYRAFAWAHVLLMNDRHSLDRHIVSGGYVYASASTHTLHKLVCCSFCRHAVQACNTITHYMDHNSNTVINACSS